MPALVPLEGCGSEVPPSWASGLMGLVLRKCPRPRLPHLVHKAKTMRSPTGQGQTEAWLTPHQGPAQCVGLAFT